MPWTFAANLIGTAQLSSEGFFNILATAKTAGWTCPKDSDGTTYAAGGGQLTHGLTGANGMCNASAWFVMRDPAGGRSFCVQRDATQSTIYTARVKYSPAAGFVGGAPSATQVPSATDEVVLQGGGTDAAPTFTDFFGNPNTIGYRQCMGFGDASMGYSFWHVATGNFLDLATTCGVFVLDVMQVGSYPSADLDPAVVWAPNSGGGNRVTSFFYDNFFNYTARAKAFMGAIASANWLSMYNPNIWGGSGQPYFSQNGGPVGGSGLGSNPWTGKDRSCLLPYARLSGQPTAIGFKGISRFMRQLGWSRQIGDLFMKTTFGDYLCISQQVAVPWNGVLLKIQ